jgi:hypothetical protein
VRTSLSRVTGIAAGLALIAAPLALTVPAEAADPGFGSLTVKLVDDLGKPVNGVVTLIPSDPMASSITMTPTDPDVLQSTYTQDVPMGDYAVAVVGGWGIFGCAGVEPCLPIGGAPTFKSAVISLADQETETYTFTTKTPTLDAPANTVGTEISVVTPMLLGSEEIGDVLDSLEGLLGGILDPKVTWMRDGKAIKGAKGPDYELGTADIGKPVTAQVKFPPIVSLLMSGLGLSGMTGLAPAPVTLGPVVAAKIPTTTTVKVAGKPRAGERTNAWVDVTGAVDEINGWVQIKVGGLNPIRARVTDGFAQVRLPEISRAGARSISASFLGTAELLPSSDSSKFRVRNARRGR